MSCEGENTVGLIIQAARPEKRLAPPLKLCRPPLQLQEPDSTTTAERRVRPSPRRRHVDHTLCATAEGTPQHEEGTRSSHTAPQKRWPWTKVRCAHGASRVLGLMGRLPPHDGRKVPRAGRDLARSTGAELALSGTKLAGSHKSKVNTA